MNIDANRTDQLYREADDTVIREYEQAVMAAAYPNVSLGLFDYGKISNKMEDEVRNPAWLHFIRVILHTITDTAPEPGVEGSIQTKTREWLKSIKLLASGKYGNTLSVGLNKVNNFFAIKYPHPRDTASSITHEYAVGILMNRLRDQYIPNFVYTYYRIACTSPVISRYGELEDWCRPSTPFAPSTSYLILENIRDSQTLTNLLLLDSDLTITDYLTIVYQLFRTLKVARRMMNFTHWDLHADNILIRRLVGQERDMWIKYDEEYISTNGILAVAIDFGMSSIEMNGTVVGPGSDVPSNFSGSTNYYADVYRILISSYYVIRQSKHRTLDRQNILKWIEKILPLFWDNITLSSTLMQTIGLSHSPTKQELINALGEIDTRSALYMWLKVDDTLDQTLSMDVFFKSMDDEVMKLGVYLPSIIRRDATGLTLFGCDGTGCTPSTQVESITHSHPRGPLQTCYAISKVSNSVDQVVLANDIVQRGNYLYEQVKRPLEIINKMETYDFGALSVSSSIMINIGAYLFQNLSKYAEAILEYWLHLEDIVLLVRECFCIAKYLPSVAVVGNTFNNSLIAQVESINNHLNKFREVARTYPFDAVKGTSNNADIQWLNDNLHLVLYTISLPVG